VNEIEFRVLGPVEVLRGRTPLRVAGSTTLTLLTGLLLSPNRVIPIETLTNWAWPGELPAHPRAALHNGISRLRHLIGSGFVDTLSWGYRLRVDADHHDLLAFEQLRTSARTAAAYGQLELALADLDRAAALWRTPLLGNVDSVSLERDRIPDLTERYLSVIEERNELRLRLGLQAPLLEELPELIRTHPFRERLIAQLMTALARAGRRVDALNAYEKLRIALDAELGIDPGASLQLLRTQILRDELPDLAAVTVVDAVRASRLRFACGLAGLAR
jgi:DNA-binding SARP family transcriptional activator